ncbi:MAG: hypothetical protein ABI333_30455 [bacterium]
MLLGALLTIATAGAVGGCALIQTDYYRGRQWKLAFQALKEKRLRAGQPESALLDVADPATRRRFGSFTYYTFRLRRKGRAQPSALIVIAKNGKLVHAWLADGCTRRRPYFDRMSKCDWTALINMTKRRRHPDGTEEIRRPATARASEPSPSRTAPPSASKEKEQ